VLPLKVKVPKEEEVVVVELLRVVSREISFISVGSTISVVHGEDVLFLVCLFVCLIWGSTIKWMDFFVCLKV
jgi:hypothetical protein